MKKLLLIASLLITTLNLFSQTVNLKLEKDSSLTGILNAISFYKKFHKRILSITLVTVSNESGSANTPETDEVSEKLYIGISDSDEYPKRMLYSIDNLIYPREYKFTEKSSNNIILSFKYGPKLKPVSVEIKITNEGLTYLK